MNRKLAVVTRSAAALGLATVGLVGLGAGAAHATGPLYCSDQLWSNYKAEYRICLQVLDNYHGVVKWAVNTRYASTDEHFYLKIDNGCGGGNYNADWNDVNQSAQNVGQVDVSCANAPYGATLTIDAGLIPYEGGQPSGVWAQQ